MSNTCRPTQLNGRSCCYPRNCPPPTTWSQFPATQTVDLSCNRLMDVSGITFCDGTSLNTGIAPQPTTWSQYPATQDMDLSCNRLVDVSGINFCDGTYINSGIYPTSSEWSQYPATHTMDLSCNKLVDVSSITFCDGTYIGTGNSFDISSSQVLVLSGTADISGASIVSSNRIYQQLYPSSSWNAVNGYYALAKDSAPALNPSSSGAKAISLWISRSIPVNTQWRSVCWVPELGIFVAVSSSGTGNRVMTSSNGISWTLRSNPVDNDWYSVTWGAGAPNGLGGKGLLIATSITGGTDRVMTSPNGINWTIQTTPLALGYISSCWSQELGLFVAVSTNITTTGVMTSPDGVTWTPQNTPSGTSGWRSICWSAERGIFVAVANQNVGFRAMTSRDGITWTERATPVDNNWTSVCWSPERGIFVAVSISGTNTNRVMTSPDGINWTIQTTPNIAEQWGSVIWSPELGQFVATSIVNQTRPIMSSPDGIIWTLTTQTGLSGFYRGIAWSPELGIFCVVSSSSNVITSSIQAQPPTSYNVFDSSFNRIDQSGNWTIQQVLKSGTFTATPTPTSITVPVTGLNLLYFSDPSNNKTITNFTGGVANQQLVIVFNNSCRITPVSPSSTLIRLSGGTSFLATPFDTLTLLFTGTEWVELSRSVNPD